MRRFFVEPQLLQGRTGLIGGELYRHLVTVLRLSAGDAIRLADGNGNEAVATIVAVEKEGLRVEIEPVPAAVPAADMPPITIYQGLPKGEKIDLILQKCTELGVARIVPFMASRSVTRLEGERLDKRVSRWQRIAKEAARQSGRDSVPEVGFGANLDAILQEGGECLRLMLWENEEEQGLRSLLATTPKPGAIAVIIGPEGGLSEEEAARAVAAGYLPVSLGKRILRTETAGLAVVSVLQYVWGDLG